VSAERRRSIVERDKRHLWHPYTPMGPYRDATDPLVIERAEGVTLHDVDGRAYLDANSSWWAATLGHNHPRLVAALREQAGRLCHTALAGITHEPAAHLAAELAAVAPEGLEHVFLSDNGSTAVEVAMKMALQYWQQNGRPARKRFVALEGAFHGETLGVTALGGVEVFRRPYAGVLLDCIHVPSPGDDAAQARAFDALAAELESRGDEIAAVVLEPLVQGASGMRIHAPEYLQAVREACTRHDTFLVLDEVFTGYGRTGRMWACAHAGVTPDFLCTGKGFSGGMLPMAATVTTPRVFEGFLGDPERAFWYGHTYCGNPLGAAVALEVLRIFREEKILESIQPRAARIAEAFAAMADLPGVARTRSLGMIGALDLEPAPRGRGGPRVDHAHVDPVDLEGDSGYLAEAGWRVFAEARKRGVYLRPLGNVVYVAPPLVISSQELETLLAVVRESVSAAAG